MSSEKTLGLKADSRKQHHSTAGRPLLPPSIKSFKVILVRRFPPMPLWNCVMNEAPRPISRLQEIAAF